MPGEQFLPISSYEYLCRGNKLFILTDQERVKGIPVKNRYHHHHRRTRPLLLYFISQAHDRDQWLTLVNI
jgi:hypothetical protein